MNKRYNYNSTSGQNRRPSNSTSGLYGILAAFLAIAGIATILDQKSDCASMEQDINILRSDVERLTRITDSLSAKKPEAPMAKAPAEKARPTRYRPERDTIKKPKQAAAAPAQADTTKAI